MYLKSCSGNYQIILSLASSINYPSDEIKLSSNINIIKNIRFVLIIYYFNLLNIIIFNHRLYKINIIIFRDV